MDLVFSVLSGRMKSVWTLPVPARCQSVVRSFLRPYICGICGGPGCQFCKGKKGEESRERYRLHMEGMERARRQRKNQKEKEQAERMRMEQERKRKQLAEQMDKWKSEININAWATIVRKTILLDIEMQYSAPMVALGNIEKILDFFCREFFSVEKHSLHCAFCHQLIRGNDSRALISHQSNNKRCLLINTKLERKNKCYYWVSGNGPDILECFVSTRASILDLLRSYVIAAFGKCYRSIRQVCMQWLVYIFRGKKTDSELDGRGQSGVLLRIERLERVAKWLGIEHQPWKRELMSDENKWNDKHQERLLRRPPGLFYPSGFALQLPPGAVTNEADNHLTVWHS